MEITRQATVQVAAGCASGAVLEVLFPKSAVVNGGNFLKVALEAGAQVTLNAALSYYGMQQLVSWGLLSQNDVTKNIGWFFGVYAAQPNLVSKLTNLTQFAVAKVTNFQMVDMAPVLAMEAGKQGNPVNQDYTRGMTVTVGAKINDFTNPDDDKSA